MPPRSDSFARLLKAGIASIAALEGKTAPVIEDDLGAQIGVTGFQIQRYKAGTLPPAPRATAILAEACVQRGLLGKTWLDQFLRAAQHPAPERVGAQLFPDTPARPRAPRAAHNLPPPIYGRFVMRAAAYNTVLDGLRRQYPVVRVLSLGGMGKTTLAREVAARCLEERDGAPRVAAAVWVSDQDRPGTTNLSVVLETIARTLDYPGLASFAFDEKRDAVEQLLRAQRVLLVVDNAETITDAALLAWLTHIPAPSQVLLTAREDQPALRGAWTIDLSGMSPAEARELIVERVAAQRLSRLVDDPARLAPLAEAVGGNPKAIELALGQARLRPLAQVIAELQAQDDLFADLFSRAWGLLDDSARRVLLALTLFPSSAGGEALAATAGVAGSACGQAVERLAALALLDILRSDLDRAPRYGLHPLVRAFAAAQLAAQPKLAEALRARWLEWYVRFTEQVGFCWSDLDRLTRLDPEHETAAAALEWAVQQGHDAATIALVEGVRYYYNVRGLWDDRLTINEQRAQAAHRLGNHSEEVLALAQHVEVRSKQGALDEAAAYLQRMRASADGAVLSDDARFECQHAEALYARAGGNLAEAEQIWRALLAFSARLGGQQYVVNRRWLATALLEQGRVAEAQQLYRDSLADARAIHDLRSVTGNTLKLAAIDLAQGDLESAAAALAECAARARQYDDRRRLAEAQRLAGQLYTRQGSPAAGRAAFADAVDHFTRLGMRRERDQAQAELSLLLEKDVGA